MQFFGKAAFAATLSLAFPVLVSAQDAQPADSGIKIELNNAEATEAGGCRLTMVTTNMMDAGIDRAAWQVAIFDGQGVVQALPILDFGTLSSGKTKVALFELADRACTDISRIVINDVAECRGADQSDLSAACLSGLTTQTRTDIDFGV